jgi:diaminopropionate ammonia-lyase
MVKSDSESAAAGLVALRLAIEDARAREKLRLNSESVILLFGTEGATDPQLYQEITGTSYAL